MSDIDFLNKETEELELMEEMGTYPPRFHVVITCLSATTDNITILFKGAVNDLEFPMSLIPSPTSPSKWTNLVVDCIPRKYFSSIVSISSGYLSSHEQEVATATTLGMSSDIIGIL